MDLHGDTTLKKLYYQQSKLTYQGLIRCDVNEILTNAYVCQMIYCKSQFSFNIIIVLHTKFRKLMKEIMTLLNSPITSLFINPKLITSIEAMFSFDELIQ